MSDKEKSSNNVVNLADYVSPVEESEAVEYIEGPVICLACKHEWTETCNLGEVEEFVCPECTCKKGVYTKIISPAEEVMHCGCGNVHFIVSVYRMMCSACGDFRDIELAIEE